MCHLKCYLRPNYPFWRGKKKKDKLRGKQSLSRLQHVPWLGQELKCSHLPDRDVALGVSKALWRTLFLYRSYPHFNSQICACLRTFNCCSRVITLWVAAAQTPLQSSCEASDFEAVLEQGIDVGLPRPMCYFIGLTFLFWPLPDLFWRWRKLSLLFLTHFSCTCSSSEQAPCLVGGNSQLNLPMDGALHR